MAQRAATFYARQNLLEQVLNLKLDSKATIRDVVSESDRTDVYASGLLGEDYTVDLDYGDDMVTVKRELKLSDVYNYLKTQNLI